MFTGHAERHCSICTPIPALGDQVLTTHDALGQVWSGMGVRGQPDGMWGICGGPTVTPPESKGDDASRPKMKIMKGWSSILERWWRGRRG